MIEFSKIKDNKLSLIKSEEKDTDWHYSKMLLSSNIDYMNVDYDYTDLIPYIDNQYNTGFCWAFSTALLQASHELRETGRKAKMSPFYIAKKGKERDNDFSTEGSTMLNSVQTICYDGVIHDDLYDRKKYIVGSLNFPEVENEEKIRKYKSSNYARCDNLEDIIIALSNKKLPLLGIQCTSAIYDLKDGKSKFLEFDENGKIIIIGAHQVLVCGHFPNMMHNGHKGFLKCANSWGESYGENGFFYIPDDYVNFKSKDGFFSMMVDSFVTVDLKDDEIKKDTIEMWIGNDKAYFNDKIINLDCSPIIKNDRALVPLRFISESFGCNVEWYDKENKIVITKEDKKITMYIGSENVYVNGVLNVIDTKPIIQNERTLVPLRFISETLGFTVLWHGSNVNKITILR